MEEAKREKIEIEKEKVNDGKKRKGQKTKTIKGEQWNRIQNENDKTTEWKWEKKLKGMKGISVNRGKRNSKLSRHRKSKNQREKKHRKLEISKKGGKK